MNGNMILLLPMILPLIAGLITGFLKEEKQCNLWVFIVMAVEAGLVWMLAFGDYTLEVLAYGGLRTGSLLHTIQMGWRNSLPA